MRAATVSALSAALSCTVLMTACGTRSGSLTDGANGAVSGGPALPGDPDDLAQDGVRITGMSGWSNETPAAISAEFEVANRESEPFTYAITFSALSGSGAALGNTEQTVPAVGPGQTVTRTVRLSLAAPPDLRGGHGRVGIAKVRRVPTAEAPAETGPCPPSGVRLTADEGDAAMGLRVVGLHLTNCGTRAYRLNGFPLLELLDKDHKPVSAVNIFKGSGGIATVTGFDDPARPLVLEPGQTADAGLMWRNTNDGSSAPINAPYVRVRAEPGAPPVMVTPELDLGTTGRLGVRPWRKTREANGAETGDNAPHYGENHVDAGG